MKKEHIINLYQTEYFSSIDIHFAKFILDISGKEDPDIFLAAALVSNATGAGDVCLDLSRPAGKTLFENSGAKEPAKCPELSLWRKKLRKSFVVGEPGDFCPLILDKKNRLYLYRYWDYEKKLSDSIKERVSRDKKEINLNALNKSLQMLFPEKCENEYKDETNWQKVACLVAVLKRFCIISGGPGTGKTTTATKIIALLIEQNQKEKLRILYKGVKMEFFQSDRTFPKALCC